MKLDWEFWPGSENCFFKVKVGLGVGVGIWGLGSGWGLGFLKGFLLFFFDLRVIVVEWRFVWDCRIFTLGWGFNKSGSGCWA